MVFLFLWQSFFFIQFWINHRLVWLWEHFNKYSASSNKCSYHCKQQRAVKRSEKKSRPDGLDSGWGSGNLGTSPHSLKGPQLAFCKMGRLTQFLLVYNRGWQTDPWAKSSIPTCSYMACKLRRVFILPFLNGWGVAGIKRISIVHKTYKLYEIHILVSQPPTAYGCFSNNDSVE